MRELDDEVLAGMESVIHLLAGPPADHPEASLAGSVSLDSFSMSIRASLLDLSLPLRFPRLLSFTYAVFICSLFVFSLCSLSAVASPESVARSS